MQINNFTMCVMTGCSVSTVQCQVMAILLGTTAASDAACVKGPFLFEQHQGHRRCNVAAKLAIIHIYFHVFKRKLHLLVPMSVSADHMSACRMVFTQQNVEMHRQSTESLRRSAR